MIDFAKYAFNKSHAAAYAVVSYQTAYLKYYYPVDMPALQYNKSYEITGVTIKRGGSDNPNTPVTSSDISFSVSVNGWTTNDIAEQLM